MSVWYSDPRYGVAFASSYQPFVRKRDVRHAEDDVTTARGEELGARLEEVLRRACGSASEGAAPCTRCC